MAHMRGAAAGVLAQAIRAGALPRATEFQCADCGKPAEAYDHRDYTKPLQVDAVCRSCNVIRGPADVWPAGFDPRPRALIAGLTPTELPETAKAG